MTHPHYYASTSRNLDRVLQYGVYPFAYMTGLLLHRDNHKATQWARLSGAAASALVTTAFLGLESHAMDNIVRDAVTAEMGIDRDKFKPSDCKYSKNVIAREGYTDFIKLQPVRYIKDALYLLPTFIEMAYGFGGKKGGAYAPKMPISKEVRASFDPRHKDYNPQKYSTWDIIANGHVGWDMSIYMATSAYWAFETFLVDKNSYYPVAQDVVGKVKPTDGDISINHLLEIYQRTRSDQKLPMISTEEEHDAIRPLLERMVKEYNKHNGKMDVPEMVYLIGLNKINIHAADHKTVSQDAIAQSHKEIDKILSIGLNGIREENKKFHAEQNANEQMRHNKSFTDRFSDEAIRSTQTILGKIGVLPKRPESYISTADPTELIGANSMFWR